MEKSKLVFWVSEGTLPFIQEQFEEGYISVLQNENDGTVQISMVVDAVAACKLVIAGAEATRVIYQQIRK